MDSGPVLIAFDGSPIALRALRKAAELFAPRPGLVVVVWEAGAAYDFATIPSATLDLPPAQLDLRAAAEIDQAMLAGAQKLAQRGAAIAVENGMPAEALAVADEPTVSETLVRVARDVDAAVVAIGRNDHGALHDVLQGSTVKGVPARPVPGAGRATRLKPHGVVDSAWEEQLAPPGATVVMAALPVRARRAWRCAG
jgi:nucleotide-binding universal stress UspA family protein